MKNLKNKLILSMAILLSVSILPGFIIQPTASASKASAANALSARNPVNINSDHSYIAAQGDWIFFSNHGLFKIKKDGSSLQKLSSDWAKNINVSGDWVYYTRNKPLDQYYKLELSSYDISQTYEDLYELIKIKTDGRSKTIIKSGSSVEDGNNVTRCYVVDNVIYYNALGGFYRMDTNGGNRKKLTEQVGHVYFYQDWIIYTDDRGLYKMKKDGTKKTLLSKENIQLVGISEDAVFYTKLVNSKGVADVYRMSLKDSKISLVLKNMPSADEPVIVVGKYIYFLGAYAFNRINLADAKNTVLYRFDGYSSDQKLNIGGDYLFFYDDTNNDSSKKQIYKLKHGSTKIEPLIMKAKPKPATKPAAKPAAKPTTNPSPQVTPKQ